MKDENIKTITFISVFVIIYGLVLGLPVASMHYPDVPDESEYCKLITHGDASCTVYCYTYDRWYWTDRTETCIWVKK